MTKDWSEMDSGWTPDREVVCGLLGKRASFTLGHGWDDNTVEPAESSSAWYMGFREDVDPEVVVHYQASHPQARISLERWETKEKKLQRVTANLIRKSRYQIQIAGGSERVERTLQRLQAEPLAEELHWPEYCWTLSATHCLSDCGVDTKEASDPSFLTLWQKAIEEAIQNLPTWVAEAELKMYPKATFIPSRDGRPMAYVKEKVSFPQRGSEVKVGETWYVEVTGQNPKGTVNFLRPVKKVS